MYTLRFDEQSNAADWVDHWQIIGENGEPANIYADGWAVKVRINTTPRASRSGHYYGGADQSGEFLIASTDDGTLTVNSDDALEWRFTASQMSQLPPGAYAVSCIATKAGQTVQLFLGTLPIIQGV